MMSSIKFTLRFPLRKSAKHQTSAMTNPQNKMRLNRLMLSAAKNRFRSFRKVFKNFIFISSWNLSVLSHAFLFDSFHFMLRGWIYAPMQKNSTSFWGMRCLSLRSRMLLSVLWHYQFYSRWLSPRNQSLCDNTHGDTDDVVD